MAPLGRQLVSAACRSSCRLHYGGDLFTRQSRAFTLSPQVNVNEPKFTGFRLTPREPITDLVTHPRVYDGPDPAPVFLDNRVQTILKSLSGCDHEKAFQHRKVMSTAAPGYVFITDKELKKAQKRAEHKSSMLLRMPPVLSVKPDTTEVITKDPAVQGLYEEKFIFTDITPGISDNRRLIVTRESDGTLQHANIEERRRMNETYNPRYGRSLVMPELFSAARLKEVLSRELYELVLEKACVQLEPDEALFQAILATAFDAVDECRHFDALLSTRFYGSMLFYLLWHARADAIIEHMIIKDKLDSAAQIIKLFVIIHPDSKTAAAVGDLEDHRQLVTSYISEDCFAKASLELSLKRFDELQRDKQVFIEGTMAAQGQQSIAQ